MSQSGCIQPATKVELVELKVANMAMFNSSKRLKALVPKGCKVVPQRIRLVYPSIQVDNGSLPIDTLTTPSGGRLAWLYGEHAGSTSPGGGSSSRNLPFDDSAQGRIGKYSGTERERPANEDLSTTYGIPKGNPTRTYFYKSDKASVMVVAWWPEKSDAARNEAIRTAEAFIDSVEPDTTIKP